MDNSLTHVRACGLTSLAEGLSDSICWVKGDALLTGVTYDSRSVTPGDLFVALRGADFDGHDFVPDAVARGASAVMVEREMALSVPQLVARDTRSSLPIVAAAFFDHPSQHLDVIGITGTDGKTTTSYLVDAILRRSGKKTGMIGTVAIRIGDLVDHHASRQTTPESLDIQRYLREMVDAGVAWAVVEATSHGLDLHRLDETRFVIGAVTNITHEHLEHHGTVEAYRRAKGVLFERVAAARGTAVINVDDPGAMEMINFASGGMLLRYSASARPADIVAEEIELRATGSSFDVSDGTTRRRVNLPLLGGFNVENALCASGVAAAAGLSWDAIVDGLEGVEPIPGRLVRIDAGQPFSVIVDYAHTPESLAKVLRLLRSLHPSGRLIVVSGSAGERDVQKRPLQGAVCARLADYSVFTSEDPRFEDPESIIRQIAEGAEDAGGRPRLTFETVTDRRDAIRQAITVARPGDCVLLAGKGHESSMIWGREKRPWNEGEVARDVLADWRPR